MGSDEFSREMLSEHNKYREQHHSPPLKWSQSAADAAQEWVHHLASINQLKHGNHQGMGQNLAFSSGVNFTAAKATKMWYDEIKSYNFKNPGFTANTGHFTQVVWAETAEIGIAHTTKGTYTFVVANYSPPGNMIGKFEENVKPPKSA